MAHRSATHAARYALAAAALALFLGARLNADEFDETFPATSLNISDAIDLAGEDAPKDAEFLDPAAADFDRWEPICEDPAQSIDGQCEKPPLRPFDWMRHVGFRHSSTDGRFQDKSVPLCYSSWLNRPYHFDWFLGPMLFADTDEGRVSQSNELFGGIRVGWDFDYYWGVEWRFGWSDPELLAPEITDATFSGRYFTTDVDLVYYPWGDTKVRPYGLVGLGMAEVGNVRPDGSGQEATLLGMPFGAGLMFPMTPWLAWRLEIMDNLVFSGDGVDAMNNISFTAGMELRLGPRPNSYWPWRSSRTIW